MRKMEGRRGREREKRGRGREREQGREREKGKNTKYKRKYGCGLVHLFCMLSSYLPLKSAHTRYDTRYTTTPPPPP